MTDMIGWSRGVRLPLNKEPTASREIRELPAAERLWVPLAYADEAAVTLAAHIGDRVRAGQRLTAEVQPGGPTALAPVAGTLLEVQTLNHPVIGMMTAALLEPDTDPAAQEPELLPPQKIETVTADCIVETARRAGIVDELDGLPLADKLLEWQDWPPICVAADATEPEPYSTAAWVVLKGAADAVAAGLKLAARACGIARSYVTIQQTGAPRRALAKQLGGDRLQIAPAGYPVTQWAAGIPGDQTGRIGPQACLALYRALTAGEPHTHTVVTVAGDAVANPCNVRVPFGVSAAEVLRACGLAADPDYVIMGDAMTGTAIEDLQAPLLPGITCLLALKTRTVLKTRPCIGCGRCARACHAGLLPYEIMRRLENMHYERLPSLHPGACDGCGVCSYVCPAGQDVAIRVLEAQQATTGTIMINWGDEDDA